MVRAHDGDMFLDYGSSLEEETQMALIQECRPECGGCENGTDNHQTWFWPAESTP